MTEFDWLDEEPVKVAPPAHPSDTSWLDADEPRTERELAWLFDDEKVKLPVAIQRIRQKDPRFKALAMSTRELSHRQKAFLKFMLANEMTESRARRAMNKAMGWKVDTNTTARWMKDIRFRGVLDAYGDLALENSGAGNANSILMRTNRVVEDALEPVTKFHMGTPLIDEFGNVVKEVDRANALKGLDLLAKARGLLKQDDENRNRVTVVLDFSGDVKQGEQASEEVERTDVLEGEYEDLQK